MCFSNKIQNINSSPLQEFNTCFSLRDDIFDIFLIFHVQHTFHGNHPNNKSHYKSNHVITPKICFDALKPCHFETPVFVNVSAKNNLEWICKSTITENFKYACTSYIKKLIVYR